MRYIVKEKKPLPKAQFSVTLEIPADEVGRHREIVLTHAAAGAEIPGFRKGHVPKDVVRGRIGELTLWEEAAEEALKEALAEFFRTESLDVIGRPEIQTLKLAPENPAEFRVLLSRYPSLTIPNYKTIAAEERSKRKEEKSVTESDVDTVIKELEAEHRKATGKGDFTISPETVKELGDFTDLSTLRAKISEKITERRAHHASEMRRAALLDRLADETKGELPDLLIDGELARMEAELEGAIKNAGGTLDQYLTEIKKERETLRKEWQANAEKRARLELLLGEIARAEGIVPKSGAVDTEVAHLREHYKDAHEDTLRAYVMVRLRNQLVIEFLERL